MGVAGGAGREPNRHEQPAIGELDAVARAGRQHLPVVIAAEFVERRRDLDRLGERLAVIVAADVETTAVIEAEEKMHGPGFPVGEWRRDC